MGRQIEIARYPMRCHRCGRADQVRVLVALMLAGDEEVWQARGALPTMRVAPEGWKWEIVDGQPLWVCPGCGGGEAVE